MASWSFPFPDGAAVVAGGAGDLGRPLVAALREAGLRVGVLDLVATDEETVACDLTDPDAVEAGVAELGDRLGPIGCFVYAAGLQSEHELAEMSLAEFRRIVDASLTGCFICARAVAPRMIDGGAIVAFSSGLGFRGMSQGPHYAAAKAGVVALVKSLALELGPRLRVNAVAPGPIRSRMADQMDPARMAGRGLDSIPLGRIGDPEDVVGPVLFLLGAGSAYMTGAVLHVNGGMLMP
jgi:3-oxoacyl-[acyl-carrier protein] reductase